MSEIIIFQVPDNTTQIEVQFEKDTVWLTQRQMAELFGLTVYEKLIHKNNKQYLIRIFVNEIKQPHVVVTGYLTSKINKYHRT